VSPFCAAAIDSRDVRALVTLFVYGIAVLGASYIVFFRPIILVRLPLWVLCHTVYRLHVLGRDNIPASGAALLVCNHVSYLDWLFILAGQKRHIHFVIFAGWTNVWGLRHILNWAGVIPISQ
jgi:1-acyl-sn-glycerol-3-phosphate acyltransferase